MKLIIIIFTRSYTNMISVPTTTSISSFTLIQSMHKLTYRVGDGRERRNQQGDGKAEERGQH